jgi:hypothetical protein
LHDFTVPQSCVDTDGASGDGWQVTVSVQSIGGQTQGPFVLGRIDGGAAPTYNPPQCDPSKAGLSATWGGTAASPTIAVSASDGDIIKDCTGWSYTVVGPTTADCSTGNDTGAPPQTVGVTCTDDLTASGWSVTVNYTDLNSKPQNVTVSQVGGTPPT